MGTNIYVGNLPWSFTSEDLEQLFESHGEVVSAKVIEDRMTGRSRGFGFVEMANEQEAHKAIEALEGYSADGRNLRVNEARPRPERGGGGGGGYRAGGGGGGHRGGGGGGGWGGDRGGGGGDRW